MTKFRALVATVIFLAASLQAEQSLSQVRGQLDDSPVNTVSYMGVKDDLLVFKVHLDSVKKGSTFRIMDETGEELFTERIKTTFFTKVFKFPKHGFNRLQFILSGKHEKLNETFNLHYKIEEKFEVSKS